MQNIEVMVTETWAYFRSQLDRARKIKVHILKAGTNRSYCGLQNIDDVGEMTLQNFLNLGVDGCKRCGLLTPRAVDVATPCAECGQSSNWHLSGCKLEFQNRLATNANH